MKSINIRFPLKDDVNKNTYFLMTQVTKEALSSDLIYLLLTEKGERYYLPEFGTNLLKFVFEMNDNLTAQDIERDIKKTVSLFIPSLKINKVTFNTETDINGNEIPDNQLNVNINFTYTEGSFSEAGDIDLNF